MDYWNCRLQTKQKKKQLKINQILKICIINGFIFVSSAEK